MWIDENIQYFLSSSAGLAKMSKTSNDLADDFQFPQAAEMDWNFKGMHPFFQSKFFVKTLDRWPRNNFLIDIVAAIEEEPGKIYN